MKFKVFNSSSMQKVKIDGENEPKYSMGNGDEHYPLTIHNRGRFGPKNFLIIITSIFIGAAIPWLLLFLFLPFD